MGRSQQQTSRSLALCPRRLEPRKGGAGAALGGGRGRTPPQANRPAPPLRRLPSGAAETSRPAEKPAPGPAPSGAALGGQAGLSVVRTEGSAPQAVSLSLARAGPTPHRRKGPPPGPAPSGDALGSGVRGLRVVRGGGLRTPTRLGCRSGSSPLCPPRSTHSCGRALTPADPRSPLRPPCSPHPCVSSPTAVSPSLLGPLPHSCPPRSPVHPRRSPVQPPRSLLRPLPHSCLPRLPLHPPRSLLRPLAHPCIPLAHSYIPLAHPVSPHSSLHPLRSPLRLLPHSCLPAHSSHKAGTLRLRPVALAAPSAGLLIPSSAWLTPAACPLGAHLLLGAHLTTRRVGFAVSTNSAA
ncbi:basic proline-rich protein-like [Equus asinus]|uniref:basic proline-rich protein-like n=1 Tax=Equus asinus TaxID=9793 RepID=UPI0038F69751